VRRRQKQAKRLNSDGEEEEEEEEAEVLDGLDSSNLEATYKSDAYSGAFHPPNTNALLGDAALTSAELEASPGRCAGQRARKCPAGVPGIIWQLTCRRGCGSPTDHFW
jgi:hypothetical protein